MMKKILIIVLVILIVALAAAWTYLLLNGAPASVSEIRENLFGTDSKSAFPEGGGAPSQTNTAPIETVSSNTINLNAPLSAITKRRIAGAWIGSDAIRYVEKGTGALYELSLQTGRESSLSFEPIPNTVDAIFSPSGEYLVLTTEQNGRFGSAILKTDRDTDTQGVSLGVVENSSFSDDSSTLFFSRNDTEGNTLLYSRDLLSQKDTLLHTVAFSEAVVLWDVWKNSRHFIYTKPAQGYAGYLYEIERTSLRKIDESMQLTALRPQEDILIVNKHNGDEPYSLLIQQESGNGTFLSIESLREKCDASGTQIWCGASTAANTSDHPIGWYMGFVSYSDSLWTIDPSNGTASQSADLESLSREQIDVTDLHVADSGKILFRNKRDDSLWLYTPSN